MNREATESKVVAVPHPETAINGTANGVGHDYTHDDWLEDPLEALARARGPYTVENASDALDQEAVELYNGWLVWQEMTDLKERTVVATIQDMLSLSARRIGFGQALPDQVECLLNNGDVIKPDACLISWQRLESAGAPQGPNERILLVGAPELVIESRSPSNRRRQERLKRAQYFANGTAVVWDVDERNRVIYVYRADAPNSPVRYNEDDEIPCDFIPNWRRKVADIFADFVSAEAVAGEVAVAWRTEGREEGIEIGEARGIETGRREGELTTRRQTLLLLLQHKFGDLPEAIVTHIQQTTDPTQFDRWMIEVISADRVTAIDWGEHRF